MRRARQSKARAAKLLSALRKDEASPKGAPRSPAFSQALTDARLYAKDPERLRELFKEAVKIVPTIPRERFKDPVGLLPGHVAFDSRILPPRIPPRFAAKFGDDRRRHYLHPESIRSYSRLDCRSRV